MLKFNSLLYLRKLKFDGDKIIMFVMLYFEDFIDNYELMF